MLAALDEWDGGLDEVVKCDGWLQESYVVLCQRCFWDTGSSILSSASTHAPPPPTIAYYY